MKRKKPTQQKHRDIIAAMQGGKCCYCGERMLHAQAVLESGRPHPRAATLEHLKRKIDGGTEHRDNKAVACHECNTGRGSTDWLTYKSIKMGEISP